MAATYFNKKCNISCVGSHVNNIPSMQLNNNILEVLDEAIDLGITVDSSLTFKSHKNKMVARAFIRSKLITKCFVSRNIPTLLRAFTVYVRPLVEYASSVWSPYQIGLMDLLGKSSLCSANSPGGCLASKTQTIR
jgi:hypothetical protein